MKRIGDKIRDRREELGMTQQELADRLGYKSKSTIAKIETNVNSPTMPMVVKFADALSVEPSYLMGWDESGNDPESWKSDPTMIKLAALLTKDEAYRRLFEGVAMVKRDDILLVANVIERMTSNR